jgi:hypothetical protein
MFFTLADTVEGRPLLHKLRARPCTILSSAYLLLVVLVADVHILLLTSLSSRSLMFLAAMLLLTSLLLSASLLLLASLL